MYVIQIFCIFVYFQTILHDLHKCTTVLLHNMLFMVFRVTPMSVSFSESYLINDLKLVLLWNQQFLNHCNDGSGFKTSVIITWPVLTSLWTATDLCDQDDVHETPEVEAPHGQVPLLLTSGDPQGGRGGGGACRVLRLPTHSQESARVQDWYVWSSASAFWFGQVRYKMLNSKYCAGISSKLHCYFYEGME